MASGHDDSTADEYSSSREAVSSKSNNEAAYEQFLLSDATFSNVTSVNANSEVNGDTTSSDLIHNTTEKTSEKSMDGNTVSSEQQQFLVTKGNSVTTKDIPSPKESYDTLPSSQNSTDDSRPEKFEQSFCKSQNSPGKDPVDAQTKWAIERGKECLVLCEELLGKFCVNVTGEYFHTFQMRIVKATTEAEVLKELLDYAFVIMATVANEQISCLASQCIQEHLNTILTAFSDEDKRISDTVNPVEHSTGSRHNTSHLSSDVVLRDDLPVGVSQGVQGKILESNQPNYTSAKTIGVVDKLISEGKAMVSQTNGKMEYDGGFARTIPYLRQSLPLSASESVIVMPAIVGDKEDSVSTHQEDTDQGGQPTVQHDQIGNQGGNQENQTVSQSNQVSQVANQDEIINPKYQATYHDQEANQNDPTTKEYNQNHMNSQGDQIANLGNQMDFLGDQQVTSEVENEIATTSEDNGAGITFTVSESSANDVLTENTAIDGQDDLCQNNNNDQLVMPSLDISHEVGDQLQDVATTTSVENDSSHTLSHHECSSQHHYLCISPGELEAEMREAILRVKRQTSPATFHAPMDIPEQSYIPINSHLPAELPVGLTVDPIQTSDAQNDLHHGLSSISQATEVTREAGRKNLCSHTAESRCT